MAGLTFARAQLLRVSERTGSAFLLRGSTCGARVYSSHRDPPPLARLLDHTRPPTNEYVGPFNLGHSNASFNQQETVKKWSELNATGKVMRTTARTTNLTVILFGAGLSAVLIYALTSELFSKNSPTVLYGDAREKIKNSQEVARYLHGPLSFHNNPPSITRPRHRNHHVSSQIFLDTAGREHMRLNFFVQGRPPGSLSPTDSYFDSLATWTKDVASSFSELTLDHTLDWARNFSQDMKESFKRLFRYLNGRPLPPPPFSALPPLEASEIPKREENSWSFAGLFSGLRGPKASQSSAVREMGDQVWTDGEVHVDLVMNDEGYFILRYLLIDMPNSRSPNRKRIFVARSPGVVDRESVIKWY